MEWRHCLCVGNHWQMRERKVRQELDWQSARMAMASNIGTRVVGNMVRELGIWRKRSSMWFQAVAQTHLAKRPFQWYCMLHFMVVRSSSMHTPVCVNCCARGGWYVNCLAEDPPVTSPPSAVAGAQALIY